MIPKDKYSFLAVFNHTKPSYKQADIVFHVYILRHILNGLIDTECMQSKITASLNIQFWLGLFYFLKVSLCEIKGHRLELVLYYGLMMDG